MYCKDCKHRLADRECTNPHICENDGDQPEDNQCLLYSYNESGGFTAQDFFGCIHFEAK